MHWIKDLKKIIDLAYLHDVYLVLLNIYILFTQLPHYSHFKNIRKITRDYQNLCREQVFKTD